MTDVGQLENKTMTANQAWRKRPRQFAPKSRLGCKTCKIRRVKCDLARPSCSKCQSTGRICDGYDDLPIGCKADIKSSPSSSTSLNTERSPHECSSSAIISYRRPSLPQWHTEGCGSLGPNYLAPLMVLPMTDSAQAEAIRFFDLISIKHLNKYQSSDKTWHKTLMFFSQTVPSVRHAATALALLHQDNLDPSSGFNNRLPHSFKKTTLSERVDPLFHYTLAIQLLLNQDLVGCDNTSKTAITLLVCYLFASFDHLAGNDVQAMKHLRGGVDMLRTVDRDAPNMYSIEGTTGAPGETDSSGSSRLIRDITHRIRRLDMQATMFLLDWSPANTSETDVYRHLRPGSAFGSLDQASDHIQMLIARVMDLINTEQQMDPNEKKTFHALRSSLKDTLLRQLDAWSSLFENMLQLQQDRPCPRTVFSRTNTQITLLRLQHIVAFILVSSYGPGGEMEYDAYLPQFQQSVAMAREVVVAHERDLDSSKLTFTPEVGILPVLYIIGAKCRHGQVRREVLAILRRRLIREAVWNSIHTARVLERVVELEEGGSLVGQGLTWGMNQIPAWQRVEAINWTHVVDESSRPRLDLTYTFCTRGEVFTESLTI